MQILLSISATKLQLFSDPHKHNRIFIPYYYGLPTVIEESYGSVEGG